MGFLHAGVDEFGRPIDAGPQYGRIRTSASAAGARAERASSRPLQPHPQPQSRQPPPGTTSSGSRSRATAAVAAERRNSGTQRSVPAAAARMMLQQIPRVPAAAGRVRARPTTSAMNARRGLAREHRQPGRQRSVTLSAKPSAYDLAKLINRACGSGDGGGASSGCGGTARMPASAHGSRQPRKSLRKGDGGGAGMGRRREEQDKSRKSIGAKQFQIQFG